MLFFAQANSAITVGLTLSILFGHYTTGSHDICTYKSAYSYSRTISSSGYPTSYSSYKEECWKISSGSSSYRVIVSVSDMDLETDCSDYVEIRDGYYSYSTLLRKWCGSSIPPSVTSSGRYLYVRFKADGSIQKKGFSLTFRRVTTACTLVTADSTITSRGYPVSYYGNEDQCWNVYTSEEQMLIYATDMNLQVDSNCRNDYLSINDGSSDSGTRLATWCGSTIRQGVSTSGQQAYIRFKSDGAGSGDKRGFNLTIIGYTDLSFYGPGDGGMEDMLQRFVVPIMTSGVIFIVVCLVVMRWKKKRARGVVGIYPRQRFVASNTTIHSQAPTVAPNVFLGQHDQSQVRHPYLQPQMMQQHGQPHAIQQHGQPQAMQQHSQPQTMQQHGQPQAMQQHGQPQAMQQHGQPQMLHSYHAYPPPAFPVQPSPMSPHPLAQPPADPNLYPLPQDTVDIPPPATYNY